MRNTGANSFIKRGLRWVVRHYGAEIYEVYRASVDEEATQAFARTLTHLGPQSMICHPFFLLNPQYIEIGNRFYAGPGLRIEAIDQHHGHTYSPRIVIGNDVQINYSVHIGAIASLHIGDNVLIGSNVLITDHSHGNLTSAENDMPAAQRPLLSKNAVTIENNVWIGEGACILPGVRLGHNSIIGANAVVTHSVEDNQVVGGVPARVLKRLS